MKVRDLIKALQYLDPASIVILQKDAEGNGYSPLAGVDGENVSYKADSTWSGEVGPRKLTPELKKGGFTKEDVIDGEKCVVLYPVN